MESNLRKCKQCNELKERILDGNFNHKDKRYKDNTGKLWNGSRCPGCTVVKARENMAKKRNQQKNDQI